MGNGQGQGGGRPAGAADRDKLVFAVGETGLKVELEGEGTGLDKPGAVLFLSLEKELNPFLISGIGSLESAGKMQRDQHLPRGIGVTRQIGMLAPSAVFALLRPQRFHRRLE